MKKQRSVFVEGARENGVEDEKAHEIFDMMAEFAKYGFNKSHSAAYAYVAYQTAYLKAHYPQEFMAALLSCGMESSDRIAEHIDDCRRMNIEVLPPDVNTSDVEFSVAEGKLSFGLGAIKGVGEQAVARIVEERRENGPYKNIFDLTERVDPKYLGRNTLETLIKAGALDNLGPNRAEHTAVAERAVQASAAAHRDKQRGQRSLFGGGDEEEETAENTAASIPELPDWTHGQKLAAEKEVFGFYLTSHPLSEYGERVSKFATYTIPELADLPDGAEVVLGGMISSIKKASTKKPSRNGNTRYVMFDFDDAQKTVRCIMWPEEYAAQGHKVEPETVCYLKGRLDHRGREPNVIVNKVLTLEEAEKEFSHQLALKFQQGLHSREDVVRVYDLLSQYPGQTEVVLVVDAGDGNGSGARRRYVMTTPGTCRVSCGAELQSELQKILGPDNIRVHGSQRKKKAGGRGNGNGHALRAAMAGSP